MAWGQNGDSQQRTARFKQWIINWSITSDQFSKFHTSQYTINDDIDDALPVNRVVLKIEAERIKNYHLEDVKRLYHLLVVA
jgi:hypothetical protein